MKDYDSTMIVVYMNPHYEHYDTGGHRPRACQHSAQCTQYVMSHGSVTEIPWVDKSSKRELLLFLGDWYKLGTFDSVFSSIASDAVHFSL